MISRSIGCVIAVTLLTLITPGDARAQWGECVGICTNMVANEWLCEAAYGTPYCHDWTVDHGVPPSHETLNDSHISYGLFEIGVEWCGATHYACDWGTAAADPEEVLRDVSNAVAYGEWEKLAGVVQGQPGLRAEVNPSRGALQLLAGCTGNAADLAQKFTGIAHFPLKRELSRQLAMAGAVHAPDP